MNGKLDLLNDNQYKLILKICFPYFIVSLLAIFTSSLINDVYSLYCDEIFSVLGYLSVITTAYTAFIENVVSTAWIKLSKKISDKNHSVKYIMQGVYTVLLFSVSTGAVLIIFNKPVLKFTNVSDGVFNIARAYYIYYVIGYAVSGFAPFLLTIANSCGNSVTLFIGFILSQCFNSVINFFFLGILKTGIIGAALVTATTYGVVIAYSVFLLVKNGNFKNPSAKDFLPEFKTIASVLKYGAYLIIHNVFCYTGYYIVSIKTNSVLPSDYVKVLSVSLPLQGVLNSLSTSATLFFPINFAYGKTERCKKFLKTITFCGLIYGTLCAAFYVIFGKWYFSRLFTEPEIIAYGKSYWTYYGLGFILFPMLLTVRIFLEAVGYGKYSFGAGISEFIGNLFAFFLIDAIGITGRSLSYTLGYSLAGIYLIAVYFIKRKKIWSECEKNLLSPRHLAVND